MSLTNTTTSYGSVAKFFHWLIFLLVLCMVIFGYFLDTIPKDIQPVTYNIHKLTGLTILLLMVLRLGWTSINPKPALPFDTLPWQRIAERIVHFLLYAVIIAMPLAGWVGSAAEGYLPHIGDIVFNLPIEKNKALGDFAFELHDKLAIAIIVLVSIHVLAALYHHFIKHDIVLRRMMPGR